MFKFLIVVLAVIAAAMAAPQVFYNTPASYAYTSGSVGSYLRPSFYSGSYVPTAYSGSGAYVASPYSYGAYPYAYL